VVGALAESTAGAVVWKGRLVGGKNWKIMMEIGRKGGMTADYDGYTG